MRASRFSEEQIIHLLQQAERGEQPIGALCRAHGISEQTFYRWRQKWGITKRCGNRKKAVYPRG
jgi:putative transposase